jgi:predicted DNA-binding protein
MRHRASERESKQMNKQDSKTIATRLTLTDYEALKQLAQHRTRIEGKVVRRSTVIRDAIRAYLDHHA